MHKLYRYKRAGTAMVTDPVLIELVISWTNLIVDNSVEEVVRA